MGLIKAATGAIGSILSDQWKEYFYCDSLDSDVLVTKGHKKTKGRASNNNGEENIISNGSVVAVNEGQCMIIVDQGRVVEFCAEAGEFTYDISSEPSLLYGNLGENIKNTFNTIGKRFTFAGDTGKDQRVYFFNTKEIMGNKYGTANPVPFRVVDNNIGLDIDISIRCNGEYSYKITDPLLFYTNVCGNVTEDYERRTLDSQLKAELMTALQPAFAKISAMGVRYSAIPAHTMELADALNEVLSEKWAQLRGIEIVSFGINALKASEEDEAMIKELQKSAVLRNPNRPHDGVCRYEYGDSGRRHECPAAVPDGSPAGGTGYADTVSGSPSEYAARLGIRLDLFLRTYRQYRQVLQRVRCSPACRKRLDMCLRCGK